jgi:HD-GYP domain-containing protein (c-di-GMP phosphodiesterase class II)
VPDTADKLAAANRELAFQAGERGRRAAELVIVKALDKEKDRHMAELAVANERLHLSLAETITLARRLVEMRDPYTAGHEEHVGDLARAIGGELGLGGDACEGLCVSGYLHDLGKIVVPAEILSKPSALSPEEYALVRNHVKASHAVLKDIAFPWPVARAALEHHERMDGSGYPNGLRGAGISVEGRVLAVADTVDAMVSDRPYRKGKGIEEALGEIGRGAGTLYDADVAAACLRLFREKGYRIGG